MALHVSRGALAWVLNTLILAAMIAPVWLVVMQKGVASAIVNGLIGGGVLAGVSALGDALTPGRRIARRVLRDR